MKPTPVWHASFGLLLLFTAAVYATPPPPAGQPLPDAYQQRIDKDPDAFTVDSAVARIERVQANRDAAIAQNKGLDEAREIENAGGTFIRGDSVLPVIPVKFQGMADPFPIADVQRALFGNSPGTLSDYYREVSYDLLRVTGEVFPWQELAHDDIFYEGADFLDQGTLKKCQGLCSNARIGDLIKEALDAADPLIDFSRMDLTGPQGVPDGFVDAVAFVHAERGGECLGEPSNIWSHQGVYRRAMGTANAYTTQDRGKNGDLLKIDTFLIAPVRDCEHPGINRIGVFVHEFAHTLGLPDLYDTNLKNGSSDSVGNWCLMSTGTYGGDGQSPERPVHLSAWSKAQLGWLFPDRVRNNPRYQPAVITASEEAPLAYQLEISPDEYYLVENRQRSGYDSNLPGDGLLIWRVRKSTVERGLADNTVNANRVKGVSLEQADGDDAINGEDQRGDGGDPFPGDSRNRGFFRGADPGSRGNTAVCEISDSGPSMSARLLVTTHACAAVTRPFP